MSGRVIGAVLLAAAVAEVVLVLTAAAQGADLMYPTLLFMMFCFVLITVSLIGLPLGLLAATAHQRVGKESIISYALLGTGFSLLIAAIIRKVFEHSIYSAVSDFGWYLSSLAAGLVLSLTYWFWVRVPALREQTHG